MTCTWDEVLNNDGTTNISIKKIIILITFKNSELSIYIYISIELIMALIHTNVFLLSMLLQPTWFNVWYHWKCVCYREMILCQHTPDKPESNNTCLQFFRQSYHKFLNYLPKYLDIMHHLQPKLSRNLALPYIFSNWNLSVSKFTSQRKLIIFAPGTDDTACVTY
jgi:hypothetical protein